MVSDCEENVGQLPSLSLIPQFSTTISAAKLDDNSFSTLFCIDSPNIEICGCLVVFDDRPWGQNVEDLFREERGNDLQRVLGGCLTVKI